MPRSASWVPRCLVISLFCPWSVVLSSEPTDKVPARTERACIDLETGDPDQVWIPGGAFQLGSNTAHPEEAPARAARVYGFWMDRHKVTNAQFVRFVAATGYVTRAERTPDPEDDPDIPLDKLMALIRLHAVSPS